MILYLNCLPFLVKISTYIIFLFSTKMCSGDVTPTGALNIPQVHRGLL